MNKRSGWIELDAVIDWRLLICREIRNSQIYTSESYGYVRSRLLICM